LLAHFDGGSLDVYQAMVEDLDRSVGRVLSALNDSRQLNDTVVLFASDNGGERFSYVWPFTGGKFTLNEGGIRVPTILSWPGTLPPARVSHEPVITMDWTATFVEVAGAQPDEDYPFDGTSLVPYLLRGRKLTERPLFWRLHDWRALRAGTLKYLQTDDGSDHLYDLAADEHEQADLVDLRPEDLDRLRAVWEQIDAEQLPYD
jgi:arylsulfatase A-like enzyme